MKKIILYTNQEYVHLEMEWLEETKISLNQIRDFLISQDIDPTPDNILETIGGQFPVPVKKFRDIETQKALKAIEAFGDSVITDGWEKRVEEKVDKYRRELVALCPEFIGNKYYVRYFDLSDGIKLKNGIDDNYFVEKNSVVLSSTDQLDFYKKHTQAVALLNELMQHPANEFEALQKLFYFNVDTKEFEMNIQAYDEKHEKYNLVNVYHKNLAAKEYNRTRNNELNKKRAEQGLPPI